MKRSLLLTSLLFLSVGYSTTFAANVDLTFPAGQGFKYGLISSEVLELPNGDQSLSDSYQSYLTHPVSSVEQDDIIVVHALVEGTHEPASGNSVATFTTYIACDGIRATPYRQKSLKRQGGNHHGSVAMSGFCRVLADSQTPVSIALMAKINTLPGIIHDGYQTKLVVTHYRIIKENDDLSDFWMPITSFEADNSGANFHFSNPEGTRYPLLSVNQNVEAGDWVYLSAQGTAEDPNPEIPMFGFELLAGTEKLTVATENPTPSELYRISQYGVAMWESTASQQLSFNTRVYATDASGVPDLTARPGHSRLEGMVFRQGQQTDSMLLTDIQRGYASSDFNIYPTGVQHNLMIPKVISFAGPGLMRIKAFATMKYSGTDVRSCYVRIGVKKDSGAETYSVVSGRYLKSPYVYHNLNSEWLFPVASTGDYTVRPYVYCGERTDQTPVIVVNTGSWTTVEKFEK